MRKAAKLELHNKRLEQKEEMELYCFSMESDSSSSHKSSLESDEIQEIEPID